MEKQKQFARIALFVIYFWFGILKVFGTSSATPLVQELHSRTVAFIPFSTFFLLFGLFEMLIGILFLFPKARKVALTLFVVHMSTTIAPLLLVPNMVWQGPFVPTLEGQYIIKNIALIALAWSLYTNSTKTKKTAVLDLE